MTEYTRLLGFNWNKTRVSKSFENASTEESYLFLIGYTGFIPFCAEFYVEMRFLVRRMFARALEVFLSEVTASSRHSLCFKKFLIQG